MTYTFAPTDRRAFLKRGAALSGLFLLSAKALDAEVRADGTRLQLGMGGEQFGLKFTEMGRGRHLVTVRNLKAGKRFAYSYNARGAKGRQGKLHLQGGSYTVSASGPSFRTDVPGLRIGPPEEENYQTQSLRGVLVGIAVVIAVWQGREVEIENANGGKVTIGGDGKAEEQDKEDSEGGDSENTDGYRAEPGMEEDPGVWY